jgi:PKD repeat protein
MKMSLSDLWVLLLFLAIPSVAQTNLALNKTVTASSTQSGNVNANAVDGNTGTRWCATDGTVPQWIKVDLSASYNLTGTEVMWEKTGVYKYKVETSSDNSVWTQRIDRTANTLSQQTFTDPFIATARYVRITATAIPAGFWASIFEFRVYGSGGNVAPTITTQPTNQTCTEGQKDTFSIVATGTPAPTYQWRKNETNIPGATSATYITPATTIADSGALFSCVASNVAGSVTSANAMLTVQRDYRKQDSLALVALYNSTGGPNWTNKTNWLSEQPIDVWFGVSATIYRVVEILIIGENNMNGTLPSEIGNLTNLNHLIISQQHLLHGQIPKEIGNLTNLEDLYLNNNSFTGRIPSEIGNLTKIQYLWLQYNLLTDSIPASIGNLYSLSNLDISHNQLTGQIPSRIGNLVHLNYLSLDDNNLSGSVPPSFGSLLNITHVQFNNNNLSGAIPSQIGNLIHLVALSLHYNSFTNLPNEIVNLDSLQNISIGFNQFCNLSPIVTAWANIKNPGWASAQTCSPPQVQIAANPQSGIAPLNVQFTGINIGSSSIDIWSWDFGDGVTSAAQSPSHTYPSQGTFSAQLIVQGLGGWDTASITIQANPPAPVIHISASPQSGYAPLSVAFSATNTGGAVTSWNWTFGDGSSSAVQNPPLHSYATAGTYKAIASGTNAGGTSRDSAVITVMAGQIPVITSNPSNLRINEGQQVIFSVTATGTSPLSYQWKKGSVNIGGNSSSLSIPAVSASDAGLYWVIVSNAYGLDTSSSAILTVVPAGVKFNSGKISISGDLRDANGNPVGATRPDTIEMTVRLMNRDTGGVALYTERFLKAHHQAVIVNIGIFAARLGEGFTQDSLKQVVTNNPYLWAQVIVAGAPPDTIKPRTPLTAVAQAIVTTGADAIHGSGDPNALNFGGVFGNYYVNNTDGSTWVKINIGWKRMD